ncbi:MAG TPA: response regulator [Methylomirabilota bacterium]|nr:response regulator [Methylomirabilota bacterium]
MVPHNDPTPSPATAPSVLVVEDEVLVRTNVAEYLRACGYRVLEANDADEAILILRNVDDIDIVFTDVQMPGSLDGFGLAQWVRRERPRIRVIITSGVARVSKDAAELCQEGPLLAKPYDHRELDRRIRWLLATR